MKLKPEILLYYGYMNCDYVCLQIPHPHRKKNTYKSSRLFYWQTLNLPGAVDQFQFNFLH